MASFTWWLIKPFNYKVQMKCIFELSLVRCFKKLSDLWMNQLELWIIEVEGIPTEICNRMVWRYIWSKGFNLITNEECYDCFRSMQRALKPDFMSVRCVLVHVRSFAILETDAISWDNNYFTYNNLCLFCFFCSVGKATRANEKFRPKTNSWQIEAPSWLAQRY